MGTPVETGRPLPVRAAPGNARNQLFLNRLLEHDGRSRPEIEDGDGPNVARPLPLSTQNPMGLPHDEPERGIPVGKAPASRLFLLAGKRMFFGRKEAVMRFGPSRRAPRRIAAALLLAGVCAEPALGAGGRADVTGGAPFSLIREPIHRNHPAFLGGALLAPYPEPHRPFLKFPEEGIETTLRVDWERNRVVAEHALRGIPLVYPWVASMDEYREALRDYRTRRDWIKNNRSVGARTARGVDSGMFNIDLPVRFPKTLSRIIGQGANIQVSGSESITFSGETQYFIMDRDNESGGQRKFPELDMRQQLQINLTGTIGEKVKVEVQHNSESQVPLENRIKLRYEGFEDEVIQKIEVGNTNLALPGNQFVSFSAQQQGLFGVKVVGKAGKLDFTTILSQQQGRTDRETYTGGGREDSLVINDLDYLKGRFFVIDQFQPIDDLRVFVDDDNATNNTGAQVQARAFVDVNDPATATQEQPGWFDELEESVDYYINREIGVLTLNRSLPENYTLGVWYQRGTAETGNVPPEASVDSSVVATLKLIRPPAEFYRPTNEKFGATWYYQLRNVYDLRARSIVEEGFEMRIYRKAAGAEVRFDQQGGKTFLEILGLDVVDQSSNPAPDDRVDGQYFGAGNKIAEKAGIPPGSSLPYFPRVLVDYDNGLLFFPDLRPFDPAYNHQYPGQPADSLIEKNPVLYDNHDPKPSDSKYEIEVKYRTSQGTFSLNRSNILEGSEVVKVDGRTLTRGSDYRIIYEIGQIEFLTDLPPDAKITVDFEYAPFLSQAQKSLAGAAGTYNLSDKTKISSIWLYKGKRTPYRRPRLGQEPSRIVVGGLSLATERQPTILTELVDRIPGITPLEESRFRIDFETAGTFPNPNTKNAVYIDDMEGTAETSSFGITRRQWNPMSIPKLSTDADELDWEKRYRNVWWYNPKNATTRGDLNPSLSSEEKIKYVPVLEVALRDGTVADGTANGAWGGIMRLVSKTGLDLKERKFFEVWINDFGLNRGKLRVDMGLLGEDAMWSTAAPNRALDTEDESGDGVLDDTGRNGPTDEDTGLDGLFNALEPGTGSDPNGDDWDYDENRPDDYSRINGTEDNGFLDTEDLNGNGYVDEEKAYFRFTIDLSSDEFLAARGSQEGSKNWRLFRVPLAKAEVVGIGGVMPTFDKGIKSVRFWFENVDTTAARFQIYSMEVAGNRWLEAGLQDSSGALIDSSAADPFEIFAAGVINNKDGEPYDPPPVEILVERQVPEKEQSLVLNYENLHPGHMGSVFRALFDDEDYTRYESMEFWVKRADPKGDFEPYPHFFFRFGGDSLNFYEFATVLDSASGTAWQRVLLDLASLTRIKLLEPETDSLYGRGVEARRDTLTVSTSRGPKTYVYSAVGNPSMTKVRRLTFGVTNPSRDRDLSGVIWVDDLRLLDVKGDAGFAARVGVELQVADFASVSADFRKVDKEFRSIGGGGGGAYGDEGEENPRRGSDETEANVAGTIKLGKFFEAANVPLPLTVNWSKSQSLPELQTASDIVLADPSAEKSERLSEGASLAIQRSKKAETPWLYYSFDSMGLRLNGRRGSSFNPTKIDSTRSYGMDWNYSYAPRFRSDLKVFRSWGVNLLPTRGSVSAQRERSTNTTIDVRSDSKRSVEARKSTSDFSFSMNPVSSETFTSDFSFATARDHLYGKPLSFLGSVNRGIEVRRTHETKLAYSPAFSSLLAWFKPRLQYNTRYSEDMPIAQRQVELDTVTGDTLGVRTLHNVQNTNTSSVDFAVGVAKLFEAIPGRKDEESPDSVKTGFGPSSVLSGIRNAGTRIGDVTASVSYGRDSRYDRLAGRPDLRYQFGLTDQVDSLLQQSLPGQTLTANTGRTLTTRASSSVRLPASMSLRFSFNTSKQRTDQSRNARESRSTTWPDLTYSWDGLESLWRLEDYLRSASLDAAYTRRTEQSGKTLSSIETERESSRWDPLAGIDLDWKNGLRSTLSTDRSTEISRTFRGGFSEKVSTTQGLNAAVSYKISSRKTVNIPILGKGTKGGSYTATTDFSLDFRYDTAKEEQTRPYRLDAHTRNFTLRPRVTWTWLQNLSGSLELQFGERRNLKNENRSTRTVGASISALFKF